MTRSMAGKSAEPSVADSAEGARNFDDNLNLFVPPALLVSLFFFLFFPDFYEVAMKFPNISRGICFLKHAF